MSLPSIHVVAGIIYNTAKDKVLIAKRANKGEAANLWEFPGGKINGDEPLEAALRRELEEELGIKVSELSFYQSLSESTAKRALTLSFFEVFHFSGEPSCLEAQQDLRWVPLYELTLYAFPALNAELIRQLSNYRNPRALGSKE